MTYRDTDAIQRLKLSYIAGEIRPLEVIYLEFVVVYKAICRSLQQHLDHLNLSAGVDAFDH